jgi:hypothetical protein
MVVPGRHGAAGAGQCVTPEYCYYDAMNHPNRTFPQLVDDCECHPSCASCGSVHHAPSQRAPLYVPPKRCHTSRCHPLVPSIIAPASDLMSWIGCRYVVDDGSEGFTLPPLDGSPVHVRDTGRMPQGGDNCVTCHPGRYLTAINLHGNGYCSATQCQVRNRAAWPRRVWGCTWRFDKQTGLPLTEC